MYSRHTVSRLLASLGIALLLSGCGNGESSKPSAEIQAAAQQLLPADKALADIYTRSCKSCHGTGAAAAPLTGDTAAWKLRMEKGMDTLVDNAINGFGGMPPFGMCMDCEPEEFEALIAFMAKGQ